MPSDLIQSLLSNIWAIFLVVLFFGGSIFVHELGHFLAARRRGVHVARFSIGFGPKIMSWRGRDGVEYRLSWLPLGGYVALPQLADMRGIEGEADADIASLPPISYGTKIIVFVAGALFNVIFAFFLASILWAVGRPVTEDLASTRVGRVAQKITVADGSQVTAPAAAAGVQPGDRIVAIDGRNVSDWMEIQHRIIAGTGVDAGGIRALDLQVDRGGRLLTLRVNPVRSGEENFRRIGVEPDYDLWIQHVNPGSPAERLGLRAGDRIAEVNGRPIRNIGLLYETLQAAGPPPGRIVVERNGAPSVLEGPADPKLADQLTGAALELKLSLVHQNPWAQFEASIKMTVDTLIGLIHPRGDIALSNLSGPIGIGRGFWAAAKSDYPIRFALWFAVLVNVNLAIFNLLPIPVLDGGHMLFATMARLRGRALPLNFIMTTQSVFIVLLFSMILYVSFFDVRRWARDARADEAAEEAGK
ncbi:MAG: RIP metalloprotease RseP [Opitutus sp.]